MKDDQPRRPLIAERRGTIVHINGEPALRLNEPISTRPGDWAEPARSYLFSQAEILRDRRTQ